MSLGVGGRGQGTGLEGALGRRELAEQPRRERTHRKLPTRANELCPSFLFENCGPRTLLRSPATSQVAIPYTVSARLAR